MKFENVTIRFDGTSPLDFVSEIKEAMKDIRFVIGILQDKIQTLEDQNILLDSRVEELKSQHTDMDGRLDDIDSKIEDHDGIEIKFDEINSQLDDVNLVDMTETIEKHEEFFNRLRNAIK